MAKRKIEPDELPSNSIQNRTAPTRNDDREQKRAVIVRNSSRVQRSVEPRALRKKKTLAQTIASTLVGNDSQDVGSYVLHDVLIPAAKNTISEMITTGLEMLLFGEARSKPRDRDRGSTRVSYGKYYKDRDERPQRALPRRNLRDKFDLSEIFFKDGRDADDVLASLIDTLEQYEEVSVADYFDLAGISGAGWAHQKYGWTDLRGAYCTHTRDGWAIVLPDPVELD